jgi:hypothetical protein
LIPPATLARLLAGARAGWEWIPGGLPFPTEQEHAEACAALGVRSSNPETWSREYRQALRADLQRRLDERKSGPGHLGASALGECRK